MILILTLILTVVLAVVVIALADYIAVGLRTSRVTDHRNETNADGAAVITWAMEAFRTTDLDLSDCDPPPGKDVPIPPGVWSNGSSTTLTCQTTTAGGLFPTVYLLATADNGSTSRTVQAVAQYSPNEAVRTLDWRVDDSGLVVP